MLIGRGAERAQLEELLAGARAGFGGSLVLVGEPGVGKTSLLEEGIALAEGMVVLRARGSEAEVDLAFSGLADLLAPVCSQIGELPSTQVSVLASALAMGPPVEAGLFAVAVAAQALVMTAARAKPVAAVVDDAQWLDPQSQRVLAYVGRRAHLAPVAAVFAVRDDEAATIRDAGLPELHLEGLAPADAELLLDSVASDLAAPVRHRLITATDRNPLALVEISSLLDTEQRRGTRPLPDPLPSGRTLERAYLGRVRSLPGAIQALLLVVAASDSGDLEEVCATAAQLGLDSVGLGLAEQRQLISISGQRVEFRHPLIRSAVYHSADTPSRRAAHRALATSVLGPQAEERRAWHLAAGAETRDESIAAGLDDVAHRIRRRAGPGTAVEAFERAADLSPDPEQRAVRLMNAATDALMAGRYADGERLTRTGLGLTTDSRLVADLELVRGRCMLWRAPTSYTAQVLSSAADRIQPVDATRAGLLLADVTWTLMLSARLDFALEAAQRAHDIGQSVGPPVERLTLFRLAAVRVLRGDEPAGRRLLERWLAGLDVSKLLVEGDAPLAAEVLIWLDEYERAARLIDGVIAQYREASTLGLLPLALSTRAELSFKEGAWARADAEANEAIALGLELGQGTLLTHSWYLLVLLDAARGSARECLERADQVFAAADDAEVCSVKMYVDAAVGLLHLGLGQMSHAVERLEAAETAMMECGAGNPGVIRSLPDLIEAHVRSGCPEDAWVALVRLDEAARRSEARWLVASSARCHGLLATDFDEPFEHALDLHSALPSVFDRARTELCYGERLRRAGRRVEARRWLRSALEAFESLAAAGWIRHATAELRATGERVSPRRHPPTAELTSQELQIARLVAAGASNREVAAALFLSTKTVEHHLSSAYRKVGVRSRTQLARSIASQNGSMLA
jgi:DNA-binding CsgD family transcriptional regulator